MKIINKLITLMAVMTLFTGQIQSQEYQDNYMDYGAAYAESGNASYLSNAVPIGFVVVAAILLATSNRHHHHSGGGGGGHRSSSSSYAHNGSR